MKPAPFICIPFALAALVSCKGDTAMPSADSGTDLPPDAAPSPIAVRNPCEEGCVVDSIAGTGVPGFRDGPVSGARLHRPISIAIGNDGTIYIADQRNHRIRALMPDGGALVTLAGTGESGYADGEGDQAQFWNPRGLAIASDGALLVADSSNHRIRRIENGVVTTIAGSGPIGAFSGGHVDGDIAGARFFLPTGVAEDSDGRIWIADAENHAVRVIEDGQVSTFGVPRQEGYSDGQAASSHFSLPSDLAIGVDDSVYVADWGNHRIRRISPDGTVSTFAGSGVTGIENLGGYVDGPASSAEFAGPWGVDTDAVGRLYVADSRNHRIRVVLPSPDGPVVATMAGSGDVGFDAGGWLDGDASESQFNLARGLAVPSDGTVYVAGYEGQRVRRIRTP